ncbi:MAG: alanine racemase, partial [Anaerolineales bacterium]
MVTLDNSTQIAEQYQKVLEKIAEATARVGRRANEVKLVVVTKGHPVEIIQQVIEAGAERLGENYAEEAVEKINQLKDFSGIEKVEWHMIGHVQSRKAETVVQYFDFIHSLDSVKLAQRYERFADQYHKRLAVLL